MAPDDREDEVRAQVRRPAFRDIAALGVRFLSYGELERNREAMARLFPTIRCGIHVGAVVPQGDRYIGSTLNLTARIAAHARGGQILCTERAVTMTGELNDASYLRIGPVRFKNIVAPVEIFEVVARPEVPADCAIDPVCRMRLGMETAPDRLSFGGQVHSFCSFECGRASERPEDYV